jgi:hypothetical protein
MTDENKSKLRHALIETAYSILKNTAWESSPKEIESYRFCLDMWALLASESGDKSPDTLWYYVNNKFNKDVLLNVERMRKNE